MSYKVGLIISMVFVSMCFLFGADLISIQSIYSSLDAKANNISYLISKNGVIDNRFKIQVQETYDVNFVCKNNPSPYIGEEITYTIFTNYQPLIINKRKMIIAITTMTVVGFYG